MLGFYFDNARCTGCRTCSIACADYHDLPSGRRFRRIIDFEGGSTSSNGECVSTDVFAYHVSVSCNHCCDPACMRVCPTGAMHKNELGLVCVDTHRCIGCGYCTIACPYHAPSIDPESGQSSKCDGCAQRIVAGKMPICIEACPLRALDFGDVAELALRHGVKGSDIVPLPDSSYTQPSLIVRLSPAAKRNDVSEGFVSDLVAVANNYGC